MLLSIKHLTFTFGSHWALKNITFSLKQGDFLFISGPSGAGKTTLFRILSGDLPFQRGAVNIAGYDLKKISRNRLANLRRDVSVVFQDFKILPHRTVYHNIAIALQIRSVPSLHIDRRVRAVLRTMNMENKADTLCGRLSGGEQQRVAIARAIVVNPKVILADEPTGNLDPELALITMKIFNQFNAHGTTIILATHSRKLMECQPNARIMRLHEGSVISTNWPGGKTSDTRSGDGA